MLISRILFKIGLEGSKKTEIEGGFNICYWIPSLQTAKTFVNHQNNTNKNFCSIEDKVNRNVYYITIVYWT